MEYENCLVELDEVLKYLSKENLYKIPEEIRICIKAEKSKEYIWKYDKTKELKEQQLNRKTIAMLSYLNMEYLLNDEQKEAMKKIHELNEQKFRKKKNYNFDNLFKNKINNTISDNHDINNNNSINGNNYLVVKENKWYEKIVTFFRNIFKK